LRPEFTTGSCTPLHTVGDLLREEGFSLQGNAKILEGKRHSDRDAQIRYLNERSRNHQDSGAPVISVDTTDVLAL